MMTGAYVGQRPFIPQIIKGLLNSKDSIVVFIRTDPSWRLCIFLEAEGDLQQQVLGFPLFEASDYDIESLGISVSLGVIRKW